MAIRAFPKVSVKSQLILSDHRGAGEPAALPGRAGTGLRDLPCAPGGRGPGPARRL